MELIKKHWLLITAIIIIAVVAFLLYYFGKKSGSGNIIVTDDTGTVVTISQADKQAAQAIATRINTDINSGWLFGSNIWGNLGRDADAYWALSAMSDTLFAYTCQWYKTQYGSSLIADIKQETSLPDDTYKKSILATAERLNIV